MEGVDLKIEPSMFFEDGLDDEQSPGNLQEFRVNLPTAQNESNGPDKTKFETQKMSAENTIHTEGEQEGLKVDSLMSSSVDQVMDKIFTDLPEETKKEDKIEESTARQSSRFE